MLTDRFLDLLRAHYLAARGGEGQAGPIYKLKCDDLRLTAQFQQEANGAIALREQYFGRAAPNVHNQEEDRVHDRTIRWVPDFDPESGLVNFQTTVQNVTQRLDETIRTEVLGLHEAIRTAAVVPIILRPPQVVVLNPAQVVFDAIVQKHVPQEMRGPGHLFTWDKYSEWREGSSTSTLELRFENETVITLDIKKHVDEEYTFRHYTRSTKLQWRPRFNQGLFECPVCTQTTESAHVNTETDAVMDNGDVAESNEVLTDFAAVVEFGSDACF